MPQQAPCLKFKISFYLPYFDKKGQFFIYIWRNKQDMVAEKLISWRDDGVTNFYYKADGSPSKIVKIHFCAKRMPMRLVIHEFDHAVLAWMISHGLDIYDPSGGYRNEEIHAYASGKCVEDFYKKLHRLRLVEISDPIENGRLNV